MGHCALGIPFTVQEVRIRTGGTTPSPCRASLHPARGTPEVRYFTLQKVDIGTSDAASYHG